MVLNPRFHSTPLPKSPQYKQKNRKNNDLLNIDHFSVYQFKVQFCQLTHYVRSRKTDPYDFVFVEPY